MIKIFLLLYSSVFIWSAINPKDYFTWFLEVIPALIALIILIFTYKSFKFTPLVYSLILIHCLILMVGGHYTYAQVPLFDFIKEVFDQSRNNYDKVGHFAQGFVPALVVRELFLRKNIVNQKGWLPFIIVCICISISVFYEFLEWFVAIFSGESSDSFLGTQGYVWDTQSDMLFATFGALSAIIFLSRIQNKQIQNLL